MEGDIGTKVAVKILTNLISSSRSCTSSIYLKFWNTYESWNAQISTENGQKIPKIAKHENWLIFIPHGVYWSQNAWKPLKGSRKAPQNGGKCQKHPQNTNKNYFLGCHGLILIFWEANFCVFWTARTIWFCFTRFAVWMIYGITGLLNRGCSHITSAKNRGSYTPPPPSVSNGQHLPYPLPPLRRLT